MSHSWDCPDRYTVRREAERDAERRSYADRNKYGDCYESQREYERAFEQRKYEQRQEEERQERRREEEREERMREERRLEEYRYEQYRMEEERRAQEEDEQIILDALPVLCAWFIPEGKE